MAPAPAAVTAEGTQLKLLLRVALAGLVFAVATTMIGWNLKSVQEVDPEDKKRRLLRKFEEGRFRRVETTRRILTKQQTEAQPALVRAQ
ncbi:hypothetical protein JKP88DRAFT_348041 [Tribonema minus]|uniref:Uncharacterized protein n=1 Tax=Tribonema minus TaxID=303371 RepID=A0A835Z8D1_9STRA|nr:hypothetical protein JKP88DRAFT_348041 [Tribonema minus]